MSTAIDLSALPDHVIAAEHAAICAVFEKAIISGQAALGLDWWAALGAYQDENAIRVNRRPVGPVAITWIMEYGMEQKLSRSVLCF